MSSMENNQLGAQVITPIKGMNRNTATTVIKNDSYFDALNMVLESDQNNSYRLSAAKGNDYFVNLDLGFTVIGHIDLQNNEVVLFAVNESDSISQILTLNTKTKELLKLIETPDLNFNRLRPIQGVFRIRRGCERVIYFIDDLNDVRVINLDKLDNYLNSDGTWNVESFSLNRNITYPSVDNIEVLNTGGNLPVGAYSFVFRLLDEDLNTSNWSIPTTPIYVYDDNIGSGPNSIDGALNNQFFNSDEGGVPPTSKSIQLTLSDLDVSYSFIEIAVIRSVSGLSQITDIQLLTRRNIESENLNFVYTGQNNQIESNEISRAELQIDKEIIKNAKAINQLNNQLWLGNVNVSKYNWAEFQRKVSKIKVTPVVNTTSMLNSSASGNFKNPNYMQYLGDEVYMFGTVFVMKDGTYSPVFLTIGRNGDNNDLEIISTWNKDMLHLVEENDFNDNYATSEVELANNPTLKVIRRYQVYNTGSRTARDRGIMAYHQSSNLNYPDLRDCNGESIWGSDSDGNPIANTPIRHHRFPSRRDFPIVEDYGDGSGWVNNNFGIEFSNIEYPHPDVVGHFFVRAIRTEDNKTILDKGIMFGNYSTFNSLDDTPIHEFTTFNMPHTLGTAAKTVSFMNPKMLFNKELSRGNYFSIEGSFSDRLTWRDWTDYDQQGTGQDIRVTVDRASTFYRPIETNLDETNLAYSDSVYTEPYRGQTRFGSFAGDMRNRLRTMPTTFYRLRDESIRPRVVNNTLERGWWSHPLIVANKVVRDVYNNLGNVLFVTIQNSPAKTQGTTTVYTGGDTVISSLTLGALSENSFTFNVLDYTEENFMNTNQFYASTAEGLWVESEINCGLRHSGFIERNQYLEDTLPRAEAHFIKQLADRVGNNVWQKKGPSDLYLEFFGYNKDYSYTTELKPFFTLSSNYDYCSDCDNYYPNRIYYSRADNLESTEDNYRVFLAQNYGNLDGLGGQITSLIVNGDELYALTKSFIYSIPTRPQEIKVADAVAYLGTGANLSIPPKRLISPTFKWGGSSAPYTVITTELGTIYVDNETGKVILIQNGGALKSISDDDMLQFFENNLSFKLEDQLQFSTGLNYPYKEITHPLGIGFRATYDPKYKLYILTKKDYKLNSEYSFVKILPNEVQNLQPFPFTVFFDGINFYATKNNTIVQTNVTDLEIFEDVSFTISYKLSSQSWNSRHSFVYSYMFNTENNFYSVDGNEIYSHNSKDYLRYNNQTYPCFVDMLVNENPIAKKTFNAVRLRLENKKSEEFFNKYVLYTNTQSTGLINLNRSSDSFNYINENEIRFTGGTYNFKINRNIFPPEEDVFNFNEVTNNVINSPLTSLNLFNQNRIKDTVAHLRLIYEPNDNVNSFLGLDAAIVEYNLNNR